MLAGDDEHKTHNKTSGPGLTDDMSRSSLDLEAVCLHVLVLLWINKTKKRKARKIPLIAIFLFCVVLFTDDFLCFVD